MKKGMSLRLRISLITSVLLILVSLSFTLSGIYNLSTNVIDPLEILIIVENERPAIESGPTEIIDFEASYRLFSRFSFSFMLVIVFIGSGIMYILSGIALRPAKKLAQDINTIDEENLSKRIDDFRAGDELNSIADSFNLLLERLEEAFQREQRFSSAAAHELKTPITVIKTNLEVFNLSSPSREEDIDEIIDIVNKQVDRMTVLVDDLMTLSSKNDFEKNELIDLKKLIGEIVIELDQEIRRKESRIDLDLIDARIIGNTVMIKHAISNIILNAINYTDRSGQIDIGLVEAKGKYYISVKDDGPGIEEKELDLIFEPFYRLEKSRSRKLGGAGLGLAIAKDIVLSHEGELIYRDNPIGGSNFIIILRKAFID